MRLLSSLLLCALLAAPTTLAETYNTPDNFIQQQLPGTKQAKVLWLKGELKQQIKRLLGQAYGKIRIRYWQQASKTAWIVEQIGKDLPITAGFVVANGQISHAEVLIFREERGWEIRYPAFTRQFSTARLDGQQQLTTQVDGITGATLSVDAMKSMARLALFLDQYVREQTS